MKMAKHIWCQNHFFPIGLHTIHIRTAQHLVILFTKSECQREQVKGSNKWFFLCFFFSFTFSLRCFTFQDDCVTDTEAERVNGMANECVNAQLKNALHASGFVRALAVKREQNATKKKRIQNAECEIDLFRWDELKWYCERLLFLSALVASVRVRIHESICCCYCCLCSFDLSFPMCWQTNKAKQSERYICMFVYILSFSAPRYGHEKSIAMSIQYFTLIHAVNHEIVHNTKPIHTEYSMATVSYAHITFVASENWGSDERQQQKNTTENNMLLLVNDADCIHLPL